MTEDFHFEVTDEFDRSLAQLDIAVQKRIVEILPDIIRNPRSGKRLKGRPVLWSARVGDYRVIYTVNLGEYRGVFRYAGHRKNAYAKFKRAC